MESYESQNLTDEILSLDTHLVHSFANLDGLKRDGARTVIAEADGAYVYDADGNRMLDGIGGMLCVNVGHGRHEIIDAVAEQMRKLDYYSTFYNLTHPAGARLAHKVTSLGARFAQPRLFRQLRFGRQRQRRTHYPPLLQPQGRAVAAADPLEDRCLPRLDTSCRRLDDACLPPRLEFGG